MTKSLMIIALLASIISVSSAGARDIYLEVGESYSNDGLNVMCVQQKTASPLALKECQFWDEFNQKCLFERKVFSFGRLQCAEECQQWDDFEKVCRYATSCQFFPDRKIFVKTTCRNFDTFNKVCREQMQTKINGR
ncbi:MAG: hypothetical protein KKB30_06100 [Proteobacteria bacterium]|nr:hypothetical protein [Pseudomonadota bacterium]MBU1715092.1 hypothetical protein [Pseudomonadota bacterium]